MRSQDLYEAEKLLQIIGSWSDDEIEQLPKFYREKAREFQDLTQQGQE